EGPAVPVGDLAAEAIDIVIVAVDRDQRRLIDRGADDLARLEIGRDEDAGAQAGLGGVRRDRAGEVAGRGAGQRIEPELERFGRGDRDRAVLEGEGRVNRVVLDVEIAQPEGAAQVVRLDERGEAGVRIDDVFGFDWQQRLVAPE